MMRFLSTESAIVLVMMAGLASSARGQTTATWVMPGTGSFFDAGNWDIGVVPMNAGGSTYNVLLPYTGSFQTVELFQNSQVEINDLFIDSQVELSLNNSADLEVLGAAYTRGEVLVSGFGSTLVFGSLADDIDETLFEARYYGTIELAATSYTAGAAGRHLYAVDINATLLAPNLQSIAVSIGGSTSALLVVADEPGALVDLPALSSTSGLVRFQATDGGTIRLGSVAGGDHTFSIDHESEIAGPGLNELEDDVVSLSGTGQFLTPPITMIDGAMFDIHDGADYALSASSMSSTVQNQLNLGARGFLPGSATDHAVLDAGSLTSLTGHGRLSAEGGGKVLAPNVVSMLGDSTGWVLIAQGGEIDLSGLNVFTELKTLAVTGITGLITLGPVTPTQPLAISVTDGALIAPGFTSFEGFSIGISGATASFPATPASLVDNQIGVSDNAVFSPSATTYIAGAVCPATGTPPGISASQGATLDLSTVTTMQISPAGGNHGVTASNGGTLLLGSLVSVANPFPNPSDSISFNAINGNAFLDLSALQTIDMAADFAASGNNSLLDISSLQAIPGTSSFYVADSASILLPDGSEASPITHLVNSAITIGNGGTFDAPTLERVTNTPISADRYATLSAPIHTFEALNPAGEIAIEVVDGPTTFAMPDLLTIDIEPDTGPGADTARIETVYRATLDLSSVTTLRGPTVDPDDLLMLQAEGWNSVLDLSGVQTLTGQISVASFNESVVMLGGTLDVPANGTFGVFSKGELRTTGDVLFQPTLPSYGAYIDNGIFEFTGAGTKRFEVARRDDGSPGDGDVSSLNFIKQLRVGGVGQATELQLVDLYDNGERGPGGEPESLYVRNESGVSLVLEGGSTLYLGSVDAYVEEPGGWVRLRDLILPGDNCAVYGNGFVCLTACPADINGDGFLDNGDIGAFIGLFLAGDLSVDMNSDGILDNGDIGGFITAFLAGC